MAKQKTYTDSDGTIYYLFHTVEASRPRPGKKSGFYLKEGVAWSPEKSPKPVHFKTKKGHDASRYFYASELEAKRHGDYMWTHQGQNTDEKLINRKAKDLRRILG